MTQDANPQHTTPQGTDAQPNAQDDAEHQTDPAVAAAEADPPAPSAQGSAGGDMARSVGQRDELKTAGGGDPLPTSVDARDKPEGGDRPTLPQEHR